MDAYRNNTSIGGNVFVVRICQFLCGPIIEIIHVSWINYFMVQKCLVINEVNFSMTAVEVGSGGAGAVRLTVAKKI